MTMQVSLTPGRADYSTCCFTGQSSIFLVFFLKANCQCLSLPLLPFVLADVGLPVDPPGSLPGSPPVPLTLMGQDRMAVSTPTDVMRQGRKYANRNQHQLIVAISLLRVALK